MKCLRCKKAEMIYIGKNDAAGNYVYICPHCAWEATTADHAKVKREKRNEYARAIRGAYKSLGMTRVRGALGGVYYE